VERARDVPAPLAALEAALREDPSPAPQQRDRLQIPAARELARERLRGPAERT
jgi:hypothetical protein